MNKSKSDIVLLVPLILLAIKPKFIPLLRPLFHGKTKRIIIRSAAHIRMKAFVQVVMWDIYLNYTF
ncbi:hypothetical protein D3C72_2143020 [compost metagenome]